MFLLGIFGELNPKGESGWDSFLLSYDNFTVYVSITFP